MLPNYIVTIKLQHIANVVKLFY